MNHKLTNAEQVEDLVLHLFIVNSGEIFTKSGLDALDTYHKSYVPAIEFLTDFPTDSKHNDLLIHTMLDVALDIPELATAVPYVWSELSQRGLQTGSLEIDTQISQSALRFNLSERLLERTPEILARVYECAYEIPAVAEAFHKFHAQLVQS